MAGVGKEWNAHDQAYLRSAAGKVEAWQIALNMNRSESSIRNFARKHGISLAIIRQHWDEKSDKELMDGIAKGMTAPQLAAKLKRTERAIYHRVDFLRKQKVKQDC